MDKKKENSNSVLSQVNALRKESAPTKSKYEQALEKYDTNLDDNEIKETVKQIIVNKVSENDNIDVKKFLLGSVELTSLHTTDTEEEILALTEKVNKFAADYPELPHVATICVYPVFTHLVSQSLEVDGVEITNVCGNFPLHKAEWR